MDVLAERGWVERTGDPADARRRLVVLTPRGRELLTLSGEILERLRAERAAQLGPERFAAFEDGLRALTDGGGGPFGAAAWFVAP